MKAIVHRRYGGPDVLECTDVDVPTTGDDEVLVRVRAASLNPIDWHLIRAEPHLVRVLTGLRRPRDPRVGRDLAGRVEAVGKRVTRFQPGDEVFGAAPGALAEYARAKENRLSRKPENATFEQAAAIPVAGVSALQALRDRGRLEPGQNVLINGASGGVGTFAVQIAKAFGAREVTAVCSTRNAELVRAIGADRVVDYTREDFIAGDARYDLILDCVANRPLSACRHILRPGGYYVVIGGPPGRWFTPLARPLQVLLCSPFVSEHLVSFIASIPPKDLDALGALVEARKVTPVIDRRYPLRQASDALRYLEGGHARGKVLVVLDEASDSRGPP